MGILDAFKSRSSKNTQDTFVALEPDHSVISLTKNPELDHKIDLRKKAIAVAIEQANISVQVARVVFVLDHSRSMATLYKNGTVQETLERGFPLALTFDDNGEMEFYLFDTLFKELDTVSGGNLASYTIDVIWPNHGKYGATCYAPIIEEITDRFTRKEPSRIPTFVIFITDGNNSDHKKAKDALSVASHHNIFWKFVGIGNEKFEFLEKLDTMDGRFIDNANFVDISDLSKISDDKLYALLLEEFGDWLQLAKEKNLID